MKRSEMIQTFDFPEGYEVSKKYRIVRKLGGGWESEVYFVEELVTGIERTAKFFYPQRNEKNKTAIFYAKKLHKLKNCPILIQYLTQGIIRYRKHDITYLVSNYVEGETLTEFLNRQPGKRLSVFQGLHLLHALAKGMADIHRLKEYHGDLHLDNIIVQRYGLAFDLKVLDMFHWGYARSENIHDDVCNLIRIFYDSIGGKRFYAKHPMAAKEICCGLKRSLILKKFKTAARLREFIENMEWE